jgi:hypothetical protein
MKRRMCGWNDGFLMQVLAANTHSCALAVVGSDVVRSLLGHSEWFHKTPSGGGGAD